jgi:hypothetical protein
LIPRAGEVLQLLQLSAKGGSGKNILSSESRSSSANDQ